MAGFERNQIDVSRRVMYAAVLVAVCFSLVVLRLWYLQVLQSNVFVELSETNRIRIAYISPPRGLILDRNGEVLVNNRPSFNLEFFPEDSPNPKETIQNLARILGTDGSQIANRMKLSDRKRRRFEPRLILKDISRDVVARIAARRYLLPGVIISVVPAREYVHGEFAAHTLGYLREVSASQLDQPDFASYHRGDLVGQTGVEKIEEPFLRGVAGKKEVVVNATGHRIREEQKEAALPGHNLVLTLDSFVQDAAEKALNGKMGAVVAMAVDTGEILALASRPGFDPNVFIGELTPATWADLAHGPLQRLSNRGVQGMFAPGSTFKMVMAAASLNEGIVGKHETVSCPGKFFLGNHSWDCWKKGGHGITDLKKAIRESCNVYFYTMGQRLGIERIADYGNRFGFGQLTGIDLPDELKGVMPSPEWKKQYYRNASADMQRWWPGETPSVAIGQGAVAVTPIQLVRAYAAAVNGGNLMQPHVVKRVYREGGGYDHERKPLVVNKLGISAAALDEVRKGLVAVVNEPGGTGGHARLDQRLGGILAGGKTGTAQRKSTRLAEKGGRLLDNAWFAGFAPSEKPEIAVVALVIGGGHGGSAAAPVVRQVMESYFSKKTGIDLALPAVPVSSKTAASSAPEDSDAD